MEKSRRNWEIIDDEKRRSVIDGIIGFFKDERDEEIGVLAAEKVLDFLLQEIGPYLYNKGVDDARKFLKDRLEGLELDMDALVRK